MNVKFKSIKYWILIVLMFHNFITLLGLDLLLFYIVRITHNVQDNENKLINLEKLSSFSAGVTFVWKGKINKKKLNPWFITGFTDAEGSFILGIYKNNKYKTAHQVQLIFKISSLRTQ